MSLSDQLSRVDRFQQRHRRVSFLAAVIKKFGDDQAGQLAALISYYAFVSIFPLLLVFVSVLGFVIHGDPVQQQKVLNGTLGQVPLLSNLITASHGKLNGSSAALGIGTVTAVLGGLGVTNAAQNAFNQIWHVPYKQRPDFLKARLRGLGLLVILGTLVIASTAAAGFATAATHGPLAEVGSIALALVFNLMLFATAFKLLTAADVALRDLTPGIVTAAIGWQIVQHLGGLWARKFQHEAAAYGTVTLVLSLLALLYLGAQITIFAAEINVVRLRRLWPRSLFSPPLTDADKRALTGSAETEERVHEENVEVSFDSDGGSDASRSPAADGR
jgi:YihY family inner membrane protein